MLTGEFVAKDNRPEAYSGRHRLEGPRRFNSGRSAHPPVTFTQERLRIEERLPAAQKFIRERKLNEMFSGASGGFICSPSCGVRRKTYRHQEEQRALAKCLAEIQSRSARRIAAE